MTIEIFKEWKDRISFDQLKLFNEVLSNPNKTDKEIAEALAENEKVKQLKAKIEKRIKELETT